MGKMYFEELELKGSFMIIPFLADDKRGFFVKDYSIESFESAGIKHQIKEVFYSFSRAGVIRGEHFQRIKPQAKLVSCISGKIYDVIIDLRKESPTFLQWRGYIIDGKNKKAILVPPGFGHGFMALEDSCVCYKCNECFYEPGDGGIRFDDPDMGIIWPYDLVGGKEKIIVSEKDKNLPSLKFVLNNYNDLY